MTKEQERRSTRLLKLPTALSPLAGWPRLVFLVVWIVALVVALFGTIAAARDLWHEELRPATLLGITVDPYATPAVLGPPVGRESAASGIKRGDLVLTIDGAAASRDPERLQNQLAGPIGASVVIETLSVTGERFTHRLTRDPRHRSEGLAAAGMTELTNALVDDWSYLVFGCVVVLGCAMILLFRRWRDPLAPWASLMMLLQVLASSPAGYWYRAQGPSADLFIDWCNVLAYSLLVGVLAIFPHGRFTPRWSWLVILAWPIVAVLIWDWTLDASNIILGVFLVACVVLIGIRYRRMEPGDGRQQVRWALMGFAASILALTALAYCQALEQRVTTYPAWLWTFIGETWAFSLTVVLLMVGLTVSLLRYRLYDADATISLSATYGALTIMLVPLFAATQKVIESVGEQFLGGNLGAMAGGIAAGVAAVMVGPLHRWTSGWAEQRFRRHLLALRHGLPLLIADMRETSSPSALAAAVLERVERGVRAQRSALLAGSEVLAARGFTPSTMPIST